MCTQYSADWVEVYGTKYQLPFALLIDKTEDDDLVFGEVTQIYVAQNCLFCLNLLPCKLNIFLIPCMCMLYYCHRYHKETFFVINHKDLSHFHPIGLYHRRNITDNSLSRFAVPQSNVIVP